MPFNIFHNRQFSFTMVAVADFVVGIAADIVEDTERVVQGLDNFDTLET